MTQVVIRQRGRPGSAAATHSCTEATPRLVSAALAIFVGVSAANAMGGLLQLVFLCLCVGVMLLRRHYIPIGLMGGVVLCGMIATFSSLRVDLSIAPLLRFVRPFVEGYLLAIFLYHGCRIRTLGTLMAALAGYVLVELICALVMVSFPELRSALLDQWYGDGSYDGQAFEVALLFRGFGVSKHHLFGFPLAMGVVGVLLLVGARHETRLFRQWLLTAAAAGCALLILPNARVGLVPLMIFYVLGISIFFRIYHLRQILILACLGVPLLLVMVRQYLGDSGEVLVDWLLEGVMQFLDPSAAGDVTTLSDLNSMVILPAEPLAWMVGNGRICQPGEDCYSDIGWIRLLQEGGLLLAVPVAMLHLEVMLKIHKGLSQLGINHPIRLASSTRYLLLWVLLVTFLLATIKGESYAPNDYSRLVMMLAVLVHQLPMRPRRTLLSYSTSSTSSTT
jgi:hypothetical protein